MLRQHPGKGLFRRTVLQGRGGLERRKPVCIVPGVFFLFTLQGLSTEPYLLVKYSTDSFLCDKTSLLTGTADWIDPIGCSNIVFYLFWNYIFSASCFSVLLQQVLAYEFSDDP